MSDNWQPVCDSQHLRRRAQMLAAIRQFFQDRQVLEVETPLLCRSTGTDPQLDFFSTTLHLAGPVQQLYLQTSPEFAMKRLLAAGSGSIYQICKAFRNAESGRLHNPEFTILEWYRIDFNLQQLMSEVISLLQFLLAPEFISTKTHTISYQQLFIQLTGLDPLVFDHAAYIDYVKNQGLPEAEDLCADQHDLWLDFIFSHCVQPAMTHNCIYLLHDYPALLPSLARIKTNDQRLTERFEVFINGIELGNGFYELADATEQEARFDREIDYRHHHAKQEVKKDALFLAALQAGLPDCSGVALGLDRLLMIISASHHIDEVLAFPLLNA
ncbi:EF-P lysine aminoacylase GenX [Methylomonas paludis]|uniref:EF-P lysine aminoacylase GenX n=1 Tax=Methylomonas paludis TaxID=1173101 RepID=A0A975MKN2_9GAMM|nr:EF-P lysine aminoacylase EpmA [Methylomonas paludis]QWF69565.1 EF-P lysine aminoacylase GenX [Methylomonas paludis]